MSCVTDSGIGEQVTIAYGSLYTLFVIIVSGYSFYFLMEYSTKFKKGSCFKKFKLWFMDIWKRRRCYVPLITHIFDQITDYSVAIQFYLLAQTKYYNDWDDCNGLNIWYLFVLTVLSMVIYRVISSFLIYQFTKSITRIIIQLLDFELLRALYINYLCDKREPCDPQRWLTTLEACLESSPQALIQMIFLSRTGSFSSNLLVLISLISSLWSIVSKLASDDKIIMIERAKRINFKFSPLKMMIDIFMTILWIICISFLIAIALLLLAIFIAIAVVFCICFPFIWIYRKCVDRNCRYCELCDYCCEFVGEFCDAPKKSLNVLGIIGAIYFMIFKYIGSDLSDRFLWVSLLYVLRVMWRILDVTSHIFLMTLIWIAIGGTALAIKVGIESIVFLILCLRTQQWELLFGVIALVVSTTTAELRTISIRIGVYRTVTNIIFMILITVWFNIDFDCFRCATYELRGKLFDSSPIRTMFIYTWFAVILSPTCVLLLAMMKVFQKQVSNSRNLEKMITAKNYDGIIEMQLYAGKYYVYDTENGRNLLMLAMQEHKSAVITYLLNIYDEDKYRDTDANERNILDFYISSIEQSNDARMTKNLMKIYKQYPTLRSTREDFSIFLCACYHGNLECVKTIIDLDTNALNDKTIQNLNGSTIAALTGHKAVVDHLEEKHNATYDLKCVATQTRQDPYRNAMDFVYEGNQASFDVINEISKHNASLASVRNQFTPFLFGCCSGNLECVQRFANQYQYDRGLAYAKERNFVTIVQYLRDVKVKWEQEDKQIARQMNADRRQHQSVKQILFMGAAGSGKDTMFKHLRTIGGGSGLLDRDRLMFKERVYEKLIGDMKHMLEAYEYLIEDYPEEFGHLQLSDDAKKSAEYVLYVRDDIDVDNEIADHIEILWKEPALREVYENRAMVNINVTDVTPYFYEEVRRIATVDYIPTDKDIILCPYPRNGVQELKITIRHNELHLFHMGVQVSEARKWIHHFEFVTAVLFVAGLSTYDQVLQEDDSVNMMLQSIENFDEICNSHWFYNTPMILCLNKKDLFADKIQKVPLTLCFPDYDGFDAYDEATSYIRRQFEMRNNNPEEKKIYSHVTSSTDKKNLERVFNDLQSIVINKSLAMGGLVM